MLSDAGAVIGAGRGREAAGMPFETPLIANRGGEGGPSDALECLDPAPSWDIIEYGTAGHWPTVGGEECGLRKGIALKWNYRGEYDSVIYPADEERGTEPFSAVSV